MARGSGVARRAGRITRPGLGRLWAPWRMTYIKTADEPAGCLFCRVGRERDDRRHLVLHRGPHALLMLNRFPYNPAHLMAATTRHVMRFGSGSSWPSSSSRSSSSHTSPTVW